MYHKMLSTINLSVLPPGKAANSRSSVCLWKVTVRSPSSEVSCLHFTPKEGTLTLNFLYFFKDKSVCLTKGAFYTQLSPCHLALEN